MQSFMKNRSDEIYEQLEARVSKIISDTAHQLTFLKYDSQSFGNVIVELSKGDIVNRFVYDRGAILYDRKPITASQWLEQTVLYGYQQPVNEKYELLFKAIEEFVRT